MDKFIQRENSALFKGRLDDPDLHRCSTQSHSEAADRRARQGPHHASTKDHER